MGGKAVRIGPEDGSRDAILEELQKNKAMTLAMALMPPELEVIASFLEGLFCKFTNIF